jgi:hypothetical protein
MTTHDVKASSGIGPLYSGTSLAQFAKLRIMSKHISTLVARVLDLLEALARRDQAILNAPVADPHGFHARR